MELHSYAKRRSSKKWTIEQKRKLVEARITHDAWFTNKPSSVVPWKSILVEANLDDFNVFFVKKQWSNMLARYKQYKQTRLGNFSTNAIDTESIGRINQEWEFFGPIHNFMTRKTTNLHSYALTPRSAIDNNNEQRQGDLVQLSNTEEQDPTKFQNETVITNLQDCAKENIPNNTTIVLQSTNNMSNDDGIHIFSSDTNEEFQQLTTDETLRIINEALVENYYDDENTDFVRNTDHDFYSKRSEVKIPEEELQEEQINYFADASDDSQESVGMIVDVNPHAFNSIPLNGNVQTFEIKPESNETACLKEEFNDEMPSTSAQRNITQVTENIPKSSTSGLTERDKYYRHKRRFNRRLEKRFDAALEVIGQIVKAEYPNIDVTSLVGRVKSDASAIGQIFTSESEGEDNEDDKTDVTNNIPCTTNNIQQ